MYLTKDLYERKSHKLERVQLTLNGGKNITKKTSEVYTQFSSVTQLCPTHCDPMNHSTPGLPVHHQLPEFSQTQAH